jgi:hypothetical protein
MMVFLPMAKRHRRTQVVKCPETDEPAEILVDTSPWYRFRKIGATIRRCSLWPKRKGCTERCLDHIATSESGEPVKQRRSTP